ncbi:unnamed protein product [Strongylus vulgaris]|uniref:Galectin n=1 Tax=Strongylus vulgaris TaxID=40348 RepID=A0A3P7J705_STRVU|nr:unnamed protein product [Strongylus vulgaris]
MLLINYLSQLLNFRSFTLQLASVNDLAVLVTVPIAKSGKITASARIEGKFTSEVDKKIFVPVDMNFNLHLRITQFVIEIYYNDEHMLDFVHRVNPMDIKEVHIEGPLIVEEVIFSPPQGASLDPLPSYEQATKMGSDPIAEFRHLNLGPPSSSLTPTPAPVVSSSSPFPQPAPFSASVVNNPLPGIPLPAASSSSNPFGPSFSQQNYGVPPGSETSKPSRYENNPSFTPTAFQQAQQGQPYGTVPSQSSPYVTSPTPTPSPAPAANVSSTMPVLQPTPYPSSSQALRPIPSAGPTPNMPYPQMPPPQTQNQPYQTPMNPYGFQQYPMGVPTNPQGVGASLYTRYLCILHL